MDLGQRLLMSTDNTSFLQSNVDNSATANVQDSNRALSTEEIESIYEIPQCADWISCGEYRSVAMQFPDDMLCDSVQVSDFLEKRIGFKPFILADTSYGSCCVDEVAAQHVKADCILHFGDICSSEAEGRIPVKYVLPKLPFDETDFRSQLCDSMTANPSDSGPVVLVIDVGADHVAQLIQDIVSETLSKTPKVIRLAQQSGVGLVLDELDGGQVIFVGKTMDSPRLTLLMMSNPRWTFFSYDIKMKRLLKEDTNINRMLKRRLYLIEKAKDAQMVGIVVGALSVSGYLGVVDCMKSLCRSADKKFIVLSIGKINVAKLSNFADAADIFVWISCPFNVMLETSDYPHAIVTPFELEIACNPKKRWYANSGWISDFKRLLTENWTSNEAIDNAESEEPETDMSLVTGRLRRRPGEENNTNAIGNSLLPRSDALQLETISVESRFMGKTWKGLEEKLGETAVTDVKEGRRGIAAGYENEGNAETHESGSTT